MIGRAATHLSFCPLVRSALSSSFNAAGVQRKAPVHGKDHSVSGGRGEKRRRSSLILVRMTGEAAMTKEAEGTRVLVIGAGAAGLVAARELARERLDVVVYEQGLEIGGVWVYTPETESDPLGLDPGRSRVHSSMYFNLRTNLPREIMGFLDYPFLAKDGRDGRRFPGYEEVNLYLKDFAHHYNLLRLIKFGVEVEYVGLEQGKASVLSENRNLKWIVRSKTRGEENHEPEVQAEIFDAVVICNGHYSEPKVIQIPGIESWPGLHMHSHNYRIPDPFQDKVIVIIGNSNSGGDISKELANVAKEVHICARNWPSDKLSVSAGGPRGNIWHHPLVERACEDGIVNFQDGESTKADVIMQCTGYMYAFPFLDTQRVVSVEDGRVAPLYKHVFVPAFAPTLSVVGLPSKIHSAVPVVLLLGRSRTPLDDSNGKFASTILTEHAIVLDTETKWISQVLSGKVKLPSVTAMMSEVEQFYEELDAKGIPKYCTHVIALEQFEYVDWLLEQCGERPAQPWRKGIYFSTGGNRVANPGYRDDWRDQDLLNAARNSLEALSRDLIEVN